MMGFLGQILIDAKKAFGEKIAQIESTADPGPFVGCAGFLVGPAGRGRLLPWDGNLQGELRAAKDLVAARSFTGVSRLFGIICLCLRQSQTQYPFISECLRSLDSISFF